VGETLYDGAEAEPVVRAVGAGERDTVPGEPEPWHAPLRRALLSGGISAAQHDAIRRGLGQPPDSSCAEESARCVAAWSLAAAELVAEAGHRTVEDLARAARAVRDRLDPAGAEARYLARYERRSFRMWTDGEGLHHAELVSDDVSAAWLRSIIDSALRPRRGGPRFVDPAERERAKTLLEDSRTNAQLAHDLIMDLVRAGALAVPEQVYGTRQAGVRLVRVIDSDGAPGAGFFEDDPALVPAGVSEQQACAGGVVPVTVDRTGRPLDVGREQRLYTAKQRIALAVRDGGCRWPGCDRPPAYCEAHHIDHWHADQGRTDVDRGVLLCRFHHMQLHSSGWRIARNTSNIVDDGSTGSGSTGSGSTGDGGAGIEGAGDGRAGDGRAGDGRAGAGQAGEFVLHDPGGGATPMPPRIELRYAWANTGPPRQRFRLVA
ncbi:HNH endonuclease signature motif containing protein, partial [Leucobacter sp. wl10]|uniref:HNH endonuclease signature motif containing protein n=1 Tax=Leucobacter sp. wl10 TaxID=2304677 RepID=UPI001968A5B8